jgi:hypothetical protein
MNLAVLNTSGIHTGGILPLLLEDGTELLLEDEGSLLLEYEFIASGGAVLGGLVNVSTIVIGSGDLTIGGSANVYGVTGIYGSGGVVVSGKGFKSDTADVGDGGIVFGGHAIHNLVKNQTSTPYLFNVGSTAYIVNNPGKKPFAGLVTARRTLDANNFYKVAGNWYLERNLLTFGQYQSYVKLNVKRLPKPGPRK